MAKYKKTNRQIIVQKTQHRKLKTKQHEPHQSWVWSQVIREDKQQKYLCLTKHGLKKRKLFSESINKKIDIYFGYDIFLGNIKFTDVQFFQSYFLHELLFLNKIHRSCLYGDLKLLFSLSFGLCEELSNRHSYHIILFLYFCTCVILNIPSVNKLIIDTRTKFCIYVRRAFRLQKTYQ